MSLRLPLDVEAELRRRCLPGARDGLGMRNRRERSFVVVRLKEALRRYYWILSAELRGLDLSSEDLDLVAVTIRRRRTKPDFAIALLPTIVSGASAALGQRLAAWSPGRLAALVDVIERAELR